MPELEGLVFAVPAFEATLGSETILASGASLTVEVVLGTDVAQPLRSNAASIATAKIT
jgi:hypothetical protein